MEVRVKARSWSPSSRSLIYEVRPPSTEGACGCSGKPMPKEREAAYGFYRYDVERGKTEPLDEVADIAHYLMVDHLAWLTEGTFLIKSETPPEVEVFPVKPREVKFLDYRTVNPPSYFIVSEDGREFKSLGSLDGNAMQEVLRADRKELAALVTAPDETGRYNSRIYTLDLVSGKAKPIPVEACADQRQQRPTYSPSGRSMAYTCSVPECEDEACHRMIEVHRLAVEDRLVANCGWAFPRAVWLDERTLAVTCNTELLVIDWKKEKVLGRAALPRDVEVPED
jgi:hypothetical protein